MYPRLTAFRWPPMRTSLILNEIRLYMKNKRIANPHVPATTDDASQENAIGFTLGVLAKDLVREIDRRAYKNGHKGTDYK